MATPLDLKTTYRESAVLTPLLKDIRGGVSPSKDRLAAIFSGLPLWERNKSPSGHVAYKHALSNQKVGWQGHSGGGDDTIPKAHVEKLLNSIQEHVNYFGNNYFNGWKKEPDFIKVSEKFNSEKKASKTI